MKYKVNESKALELLRFWKRNGWHLNQAEKANLLDLSTSVVNRLENKGKNFGDLKADQFLKFCEVLQVHPMELIEEKNEN